jgi:hypothetical protein
LPKIIDGVRVTVMKTAAAGINPESAVTDTDEPKSYRHKNRIACGSSCATATGCPGTLGALVKDGNNNIHILSCNHVIAGCNHIVMGMPIMSPAPSDAKPHGVLPLSIARLQEMVPLRFGAPSASNPPCEEDLALGQLLSPDLVASWQGDAGGCDTPVAIVDPEDGMPVKKYGRSSGRTDGKILAIVKDAFPMQCQSPAHDFKGIAWFTNYAHIIGAAGAFALPGDSGSLVVTEDGKSAVGLLFSVYAKGEVAQIVPIRHVLKTLGVELLGEHGT